MYNPAQPLFGWLDSNKKEKNFQKKRYCLKITGKWVLKFNTQTAKSFQEESLHCRVDKNCYQYDSETKQHKNIYSFEENLINKVK